MNTRLATLLLALAALLTPVAGLAADSGAGSQPSVTQAVPGQIQPALEACPAERAGAANLSAVSQTDCCKGHKGVCGCRAGKIVCCDNSVSPDCTCHSDWGVAN